MALKILSGVVVCTKAKNTASVVVSSIVKHSRYGKYTRRQTTYIVHDPDNLAATGKSVSILECKPVSKTKSWVIKGVLVD